MPDRTSRHCLGEGLVRERRLMASVSICICYLALPEPLLMAPTYPQGIRYTTRKLKPEKRGDEDLKKKNNEIQPKSTLPMKARSAIGLTVFHMLIRLIKNREKGKVERGVRERETEWERQCVSELIRCSTRSDNRICRHAVVLSITLHFFFFVAKYISPSKSSR